MNRPYISLVHKAFLAVTLILLPVLIIFFYTYSQNREMLKQIFLKHLVIIAEAFEGQVYQFIEMHRNRAQDFSSDGFINDGLQKIITGDKFAVSSLNTYLTKNKLPLDRFINDIYIISPDGRVVASSHDTAIGTDVSNEAFFANIESDWQIIDKSAVLTELPALAISKPVADKSTKGQIGILVNVISVSAFNELLSGDLIKRYQLGALTQGIMERFNTMEVYLVNKDMLMITDSLFIKDAILKQRVNTLPVQECINANKELAAFYKNYNGVEVAGASMCIPNLKWSLLIEVNKDEILTPINILKQGATITISSIAGLVFLLLVLFFRSVVLPLRKMTISAESVANGSYDINIPVTTSDEIGRLTDSFNLMAHQINNRTNLLNEEKLRAIKAEKTAIEFSKKYEMLVNSVNSIVWEADPATFQFTFVSEQAGRLLGYPVDQWLNKPTFWKEHIHPDDREQAVSYCMAAVAEGRSHEFEYRMTAADGRSVWMQDIVSVISKNNQPVKLYGLLIDITGQKKAEEARLEAQQRYEDLVNSLNVGVYRLMPDGRFVEANSAVVDIFETDSREEFFKHNAIDFYKDKDEFKELISELLESGLIKNKELEALTAKGHPFWCSLSAITKKNKNGNVYVDGIIEDITGKKTAEGQLQHVQKMEAIGKLAGGIAHDFNNIMTAILGYGNLLRMKRKEDDLVKNYATQIIISAENAAKLTKGLLSFSRRDKTNIAAIDLNRFLQENEKLLSSLLRRGVKFKMSVSNESLIVHADEVQLEQVLMNIMTNASDAMPDGGDLSIKSGLMDIDNTFIQNHGYGIPGKYAYVSIADTGIGIDKAIQDRVFEPFYTTKGIGQGSGLGLSIAYGIIKQHKGYITMSSEPGKGTLFTIYLPVTTEKAPDDTRKKVHFP